MPTSRTRTHSSVHIEFVGAPGAGKTEAKRALADRCRQQRPAWWERYRPIRVTYTVTSMLRRRARARQALRVYALVRRGTAGSMRARAKRAWKVSRGFARIDHATHRASTLVLDEGPVNWLLAVQWNDSRIRDAALATVAAFYRDAGWHCVVLRIDPDELQARTVQRCQARQHAAATKPWRPLRPTRRRIAAWWRGGLERTSTDQWLANIAETTAILDTVAIVIDVQDHTPEQIAETVVAALAPS